MSETRRYVDNNNQESKPMQTGTINGVPYSLPPGFVPMSDEECRRVRAAAQLLSDLDRSPAGRHLGDVESGAVDGRSQGNPLLVEGQHVGYAMGGARIVVPSQEKRADPKAWYERA